MRSRVFLPDVFTDEGLGALSAGAWRLFHGLVCLADRDGRVEYSPRQIKAQIFPYQDCTIEPLVAELTATMVAGEPALIVYEVEGKRYAWLPSFLRFYRPHPNEAKSRLPAYCPPSENARGESPQLALPGCLPGSDSGNSHAWKPRYSCMKEEEPEKEPEKEKEKEKESEKGKESRNTVVARSGGGDPAAIHVKNFTSRTPATRDSSDRAFPNYVGRKLGEKVPENTRVFGISPTSQLGPPNLAGWTLNGKPVAPPEPNAPRAVPLSGVFEWLRDKYAGPDRSPEETRRQLDELSGELSERLNLRKLEQQELRELSAKYRSSRKRGPP
jgi:hypothetical protein